MHIAAAGKFVVGDVGKRAYWSGLVGSGLCASYYNLDGPNLIPISLSRWLEHHTSVTDPPLGPQIVTE